MMGYKSIIIIVILAYGALLDAQILGDVLKPVPEPCIDFELETSAANRTCTGPSCPVPCQGICKRRCGTNEGIALGYCGNKCQCCVPAIQPCKIDASCGSGGKCRRGITCPKGEEPIVGRCGTSNNCRCCAPVTGICPAPFEKIGSEYLYFHDSSKMNWDDALSHCKSIGGSLAEPANMDDFIALIESSYSHMKYDIWLGATDRVDEQNWKWLSGGAVPSSLWPAWPGNQPSGDGDCMQIHYHGYSGFFLNDYYCHVKGYFVCECTPPVSNVSECKSKHNACIAPDYCEDKSVSCRKGYGKINGTCFKNILKPKPISLDCDCCKKIECSSIGDRCTKKGSYCIDRASYCPTGYTESLDCKKPVIVDGAMGKEQLCKCCKPNKIGLESIRLNVEREE